MQEGERSNEIEELEEMVKKKFKQSKTDVKAMEKRIENIEKLLQTIVDINTTPRNEQTPDEDADDEDFGDVAWLYPIKLLAWGFKKYFIIPSMTVIFSSHVRVKNKKIKI